MPNGVFAHVCLVVKDLDQAIADWTKILEVLDPSQVVEPIVKYDDFEGGGDNMKWATFVSADSTEIQLMEPTPGTSLFRALEKHGEHVHHLCFTTDDVAETSKRLADAGLSTSGEVNTDPEMPWQQWSWVMRDSAHGVLVEVARPYKAVDGKWEDGSDA